MKIPEDGKAFVAEGTVEEKYAGMTRMYVGVLQIRRNNDRLDISGAAYGVGSPEWRHADPAATVGLPPDQVGWEDVEDAGGNPITDAGTGRRIRVRRWAMELRADYEHPLRPGPAVGFVLGEMPGGRVTGWIEDGLTLTSDSQTRLAIGDESEDLLDALLTDAQKKLLTIVNRAQAGGNGGGNGAAPPAAAPPSAAPPQQ
jgi:hypothetical protein